MSPRTLALAVAGLVAVDAAYWGAQGYIWQRDNNDQTRWTKNCWYDVILGGAAAITAAAPFAAARLGAELHVDRRVVLTAAALAGAAAAGNLVGHVAARNATPLR